MLEFEKSILQKTIPQSNLLILAAGLGLEEVILQQINLYLMPEALVFVINCNNTQIDFFKSSIASKFFCYDVSSVSEKRKARYTKGGVFLITQQTLLTDLINDVVDASLVSCLFVLNAEKVYDNDNTVFMIDFVKQRNKDIIIRGYTDKCTLLNFDSAMRNLQITKAFMFPRYEISVKSSIVKDINFVEKRLKLTKEMEEIQVLILSTIIGLIRELKRYDKYNKSLSEISEDFDISKLPRLNRVINEASTYFGHRSEVRRLGKDIKNYALLITLLFNVDFRFFYKILQDLWDEQVMAKEKGTWINLESGLVLMEKAAIYNSAMQGNGYQSANNIEKEIKDDPASRIDKEILPKGEQQQKSLEGESAAKAEGQQKNSVILVKDKYASSINKRDKAEDNVEQNSRLNDGMYKAFDHKDVQAFVEYNEPKAVNKNTTDEKNKKRACGLNETITQIHEIKTRKKYKKSDKDDVSDENSEESENDYACDMSPKNISLLYALKKTTDLIQLLRQIKGSKIVIVKNNIVKEYLIAVLQTEGFNVIKNEDNREIHKYIQKEINTCVMTHLEYTTSIRVYNHVILTSPNLATTRRIEVLQAKNKLEETKVYSIYYKNSLEEQNFLSEVRNENDTFKHIIEKYSKLPLNISDTRIDLNDEDDEEYKILVDFREMRCNLPYFLYKSGNILHITTLETGDYILGQNTAIERKAISDFIQSINSGRLYLQAQMITYRYKNCYLLLEFVRRTCLGDFYEPTEKINLLSKFVIFMSNFPRLKIIWSNNETMTVKMIRNIQKKENVGTEDEKQINPTLLETLLIIPGIDVMNYQVIAKNYKNLRELANSDHKTLVSIVGQNSGAAIYDFFNAKNK